MIIFSNNVYPIFTKTISWSQTCLSLMRSKFQLKPNLLVVNKKFFKKWVELFYKNYYNLQTKYFSYQIKYNLNIILHYLRNNYISTRFFFGYPNKQRTRTNGHTAKKKSLMYKNLLLKYLFKPFFKKQSQSDKLLLLYVEFFNKLWYYQWIPEWGSSMRKLKEIKKERYKKWKFGYVLLTLHRPVVFRSKKKKIKVNKRKPIEIRNTFNIGYKFGFATNNKEIIKRFNTRRTPLKISKLKKKKLKKC